MSDKDLKIWNELNERQRLYLRAAYDEDQENESYQKWRGAKGDWNHTPASKWRWMNYHPVGLQDESNLQRRIGKKQIDQGTGSTWEALEARGLIECEYRGTSRFPILYVKMTPAGRRVIRASLPDDKKPVRKPKGLLSHSSWKAMKMAYEAGEEGIRRGPYDINYGRVSWEIWVRHRNRNPPLIEEREICYGCDYALVITDDGRKFYEERLEMHRQFYPDLYEEKQP